MSLRTVGDLTRLLSGTSSFTTHEPEELPNNYAVGIELEIEGVYRNLDINNSYWTIIRDNSLRAGGIEVLCRKPLSGYQLENALSDLEEALANVEYTLSERCSTHIHLDVSDMDIQQVTNMFILSAIFEPLLFKLFGNTRKANPFCISTSNGGDNMRNIAQAFSSKNVESLSGYTWGKYQGISLFRLLDLGTFEFRMFTPIVDKASYMRVLKFLFAIKEEAMSIGDVREIISYKKAHSLAELFSRLFPEEAFVEGYEADLEKGIQVANDIIGAIELTEIISARTRQLEIDLEDKRREIKEIRKGV